MEANSDSLSKRERKLRQFSGDSVRTEHNDLSSESDFDPSTSNMKGEGRKRGEKKSGSCTSSLKFASLSYEAGYEDGEHKSAFLPYKPRTVLTNLQRGNVQTETIVMNPVQLSFHQKAGKGELTQCDIDNVDVEINQADSNGMTPLMWSSAYGQVPTAAMLLRAGSFHSTKGLEGETAIHLAAAGGHTEIIKILIVSGASVNEIDDYSNTPLMYAAFNNHAHALNELLNNNADLTLFNLNDDTALSIAIKRSCKETQSVIEGYLFMLLQPS